MINKHSNACFYIFKGRISLNVLLHLIKRFYINGQKYYGMWKYYAQKSLLYLDENKTAE